MGSLDHHEERRHRFRETLRGVGLFQDLDDQELNRLSQRFVELEFARHALIVREGDESIGLHVVHEGSVAVFRQTVGKPVQLLSRLDSGDFFGELGIFGDGRHMASVRASESSKILRIRRQDLLAFIEDHPAIEQKLQLAAARRHLANVTSLLELGRRREVRIHLAQPVQLEAVPGTARPAILENLSLGGLSLTGVPASWDVGRAVSFGLGLREGELRLSGEVVWRREETVGISFDKLSVNHDMIIQMAIRVALEVQPYVSQT